MNSITTSEKTIIAIADDHKLIRKGICDLIESFGNFQVIFQADNGKELLNYLHANPTLPNICILDINMPELNGYDTLNTIKDQWPKLKVVMLSMFHNEHTVTKTIRDGASGYITKDAEPNTMRRILTTVAERGFDYSNLENNNFYKLIQSGVYKTPPLSEKETQFLTLACSDASYKEIADVMNVSYRAIDGYRDSLAKKLGINTRVGLMMYAIELGIIPLNKRLNKS